MSFHLAPSALHCLILCRNNDYNPPNPPSALVINMDFISDAGQPCISITGREIDVDAVTGQIKRYVDIVSPGLLKEITYYTAGYSCTPVSHCNTLNQGVECWLELCFL